MIPKTLFQLAGREPRPPVLADAVLIMIDYQNEYLDGPLRLVGVEEAIERAYELLIAARVAGTTIIHVAHMSRTRARAVACSIVPCREARSSTSSHRATAKP